MKNKKVILIIAILMIVLFNQFSSAESIESTITFDKVWIDKDTYYIPVPEYFNPLNASNEELQKYGIPERPTDSTARVQWEKNISNAKWIEPVVTDTPDNIKPGSAVKLVSAQNENESNEFDKSISSNILFSTHSANWCGYVNSSSCFGANTRIIVPSVYAPSIRWPACCAQWAGIGGVSSSKLAQLGTCEYINSSGSASYFAWYETIGTNVSSISHQLTSFSVSPGDDIFVSMWLVATGNGMDIYYYFHNYTTTQYTSVVVSVTSYSGIATSGEWIFERPSNGSGGLYYLARPSVNGSYISPFSSSSYRDINGTWHTASGTQYDIYNSSGNALATAGGLSSGAFTASWITYN